MAAMVEMESIKTSPAKISINFLLRSFNFLNPRNSQRGFTLIEIMIVLGIIAAIVGFGIPRMKFGSTSIKSVSRDLGVLSREIRNRARLKDKTFRLVFDLDPKKARYWIESANGPVFAPSESQIKKQSELTSVDQEKLAKSSPFQKDNSILKDEKSLPKPLRFVLVDNGHSENPVESGLAYVYYSPEGMTEHAAIQIANADKNPWTLVINPLTGHADIVEKPVLIKDLKHED